MTKPSKTLFSILAVVLFILGLLLGLALSGWYVWGEVEAVIFVPRSGDVTLTSLKCPLILGAEEGGVVSASFDNPTSETIHPTIQAQFSHGKIPRVQETVLDLTPGQAQRLQWLVGKQDRLFGWLILVNVYESSQPNTLSEQGSCGIMLSPVGWMRGEALFTLMFILSVVLLAGGLALWTWARSPLRGLTQSATNAMSALGVITGLAMLSILPRWWVLTGFLFFAAIMMIGIILTQFILFPEGLPSPRRR